MIKLVKKDMKLFFGNKQDMLLSFALPIVFITLFSFVFGNMGNTEEAKTGSIAHVVAGTSVMMLLFSVAGIGGSLLDEKQEGMLKKLLCSPMHPPHILYGKILFANIISIIQLIIMFIFAWLVFGLPIIHHLPSLALMILVTAYACSSFGIVLASFTKSRQQVQGFSTIIVLVMSGIGGSMIPVYIMPDIMQKIAVVTVNYWGIQGFYDIFLERLPLSDITFLSKVLTLILIGTSLNIIAFQMFKRNILKIA
jgi:ABC-2 type transport system permease protein